jgi:hypothetical protein
MHHLEILEAAAKLPNRPCTVILSAVRTVSVSSEALALALDMVSASVSALAGMFHGHGHVNIF